MNRSTLYSFLTFIFLGMFAQSCSTKKTKPDNNPLSYDHLVIFAKDSSMQTSLEQLFTLGEKLTTTHKHQGTQGKYFIFYNTFIEFLYLKDTAVAIENEARFRSQYTKRWMNETSCPIAVGLNLNPFDSNQSNIELEKYASLDSPEGEYYLMSEHNRNALQPMIYISAPSRAYHAINDLGELDDLFEEPVRSDFRQYLMHPSGIKRLTQIRMTVPADFEDGNLRELQRIPEIDIINGNSYQLELTFDEAVQGKEMKLSENLEMIIKY